MIQGFGAQLRRLREARGLSLRGLARLAHYSAAYLHEIETGRKVPTQGVAERCDAALDAGGGLLALVVPPDTSPPEDELDAVELGRRASASDLGEETLARLERAVDDLAVWYPVTAPADLLGRVRRHLGYVARLVDARKTLDEHRRLVANLPRPAQPRHHYHYDPDKSAAYTATILSWIGDPAAEQHAREVIVRLREGGGADGWARRIASAQLDLGLALLAADQPDEACAVARTAIGSGRVVPSNHWRAAEVVAAVAARGLPEAADLREAYAALAGPS